MNKKTITRYINIVAFILMLEVLVRIITDNVTNLKLNCILLIIYVLIDLFKDILQGDK